MISRYKAGASVFTGAVISVSIQSLGIEAGEWRLRGSLKGRIYSVSPCPGNAVQYDLGSPTTGESVASHRMHEKSGQAICHDATNLISARFSMPFSAMPGRPPVRPAGPESVAESWPDCVHANTVGQALTRRKSIYRSSEGLGIRHQILPCGFPRRLDQSGPSIPARFLSVFRR